jgi:hypothetical protein
MTYDDWLQEPYQALEREAEAREEATQNATIAYSARLLTNDNDAAELFDEAAGYRTPAQATAITRAILSKDAAALLALMDALHTAAFDRQVECDAVEILEEH